MIETFCILAMLFMIGYFITGAAKAAGNKLSWLSAPNSGCSVTHPDEGRYYDLNYFGPKNHIEMARIWMGSARNHVLSLNYDNQVFKSDIIRKEYAPDRIIAKKTFEAKTVKELADGIEKQFKEWDIRDGFAYLWEYPYK